MFTLFSEMERLRCFRKFMGTGLSPLERQRPCLRIPCPISQQALNTASQTKETTSLKTHLIHYTITFSSQYPYVTILSVPLLSSEDLALGRGGICQSTYDAQDHP